MMKIARKNCIQQDAFSCRNPDFKLICVVPPPPHTHRLTRNSCFVLYDLQYAQSIMQLWLCHCWYCTRNKVVTLVRTTTGVPEMCVFNNCATTKIGIYFALKVSTPLCIPRQAIVFIHNLTITRLTWNKRWVCWPKKTCFINLTGWGMDHSTHGCYEGSRGREDWITQPMDVMKVREVERIGSLNPWTLWRFER